MGQIKVRGKMQRVAVINDNRVVARAARYSTVKSDELTSYSALFDRSLKRFRLIIIKYGRNVKKCSRMSVFSTIFFAPRNKLLIDI